MVAYKEYVHRVHVAYKTTHFMVHFTQNNAVHFNIQGTQLAKDVHSSLNLVESPVFAVESSIYTVES